MRRTYLVGVDVAVYVPVPLWWGRGLQHRARNRLAVTP